MRAKHPPRPGTGQNHPAPPGRLGEAEARALTPSLRRTKAPVRSSDLSPRPSRKHAPAQLGSSSALLQAAFQDEFGRTGRQYQGSRGARVSPAENAVRSASRVIDVSPQGSTGVSQSRPAHLGSIAWECGAPKVPCGERHHQACAPTTGTLSTEQGRVSK